MRGKAVVLNFWASWCLPCKEETPRLEAAWKKWKPRGVVVVGLDANDFKSDARNFARRYGVTYPIVHDGPGRLLDDYGLTALPETFFIRPDGRLSSWTQGELSVEEIETGIRGSRAMSLRACMVVLALAALALGARRLRVSRSPRWRRSRARSSVPRATRRSTSRPRRWQIACATSSAHGSLPGTRRLRSRSSSSRTSASGSCSSPPKRGFNLLAWVLPPVVAVAAAVIVGILAVRWSRRRGPGAEAAAPDPAMERRIDDELARLDSWAGHVAERIPIAHSSPA